MSDFAVNADRLLDLAGTVFSKNASENDRIELNAILLADEVSRRCYLDYCLMHVALRVESRARRAVQMAHQQINIGTVDVAASSWDAVRTEPTDSPAPTFLSTAFPATIGYSSGWSVAYLTATVITGLWILSMWLTPVSIRAGCNALRAACRRATACPRAAACIGGPDHRHGRLQVERWFSCFLGAEM